MIVLQTDQRYGQPARLVGLWLLVVILLAERIGAAELAVGSVDFSRGTVAAVRAGQAPRLLGKGEPLYQGDNIQTGERSFAVLIFNDGAKITVRPSSSFSIDSYVKTEQDANVDLSLHKGGVRASSGEIARKDPQRFKIHTPGATVKAAQADYSVRLCENDCTEENANLRPAGLATEKAIVARAIEVNGAVIARTTQGDDTPRLLKVGAPIYQSDSVATEINAFALLVFRDGGRVSLEAETEFIVAEYRFEEGGTGNTTHLKLVKGGLRALTGIIGKQNKEAYKLETPVATMGIRGTGFDLHCVGSCSGLSDADKLVSGVSEGLYSYVWQGGIDQNNQAGVFPLGLNEASFIANPRSQPIKLPVIPRFFINNPRPRPDSKAVDMNKLFKSGGNSASVEPGVYIAVDSGSVAVEDPDGAVITMSTNESVRVGNDGKLEKLAELQLFQTEDPFPVPAAFSDQQGELTYSILTGIPTKAPAQGGEQYQCRCD